MNYPVKPLMDALLEIRAAEDWTRCAERFVAAIMTLEPLLLRAAVFESTEQGRTVRPLASQERVAGKYAISREALRVVLGSGQASCRRVSSRGVSGDGQDPGLWSVVVPFATGVTSPLVIHAELQGVGEVEAHATVERLATFVRLAEPRFETLALVRGMDHWIVSMIKSLTAAIEAKDTYTSGHSERVSLYADAVGRELRLSKVERQSLILGGLCHDVGKIGIPDAVLKKPGLLSVEEIQEMQTHPEIGASIILAAPRSQDLAGAVKHHHERFDGTGYPDGLEGDRIPLFARIIAIVDAFDAMTSGRSYSGYVNQSEAVESLAAKDDLFDPEIIRAFVTAHEKGLLTMRTGTQIGTPLAS